MSNKGAASTSEQGGSKTAIALWATRGSWGSRLTVLTLGMLLGRVALPTISLVSWCTVRWLLWGIRRVAAILVIWLLAMLTVIARRRSSVPLLRVRRMGRRWSWVRVLLLRIGTLLTLIVLVVRRLSILWALAVLLLLGIGTVALGRILSALMGPVAAVVALVTHVFVRKCDVSKM